MEIELATLSGQLAMVLNAGFYAVSLNAGEHWRLSQDEAFAGAGTLTVALKQSFPQEWMEAYENVLLKFAPWVAVATTFGAIINKRVEIGKAIAAQKQSESDN